MGYLTEEHLRLQAEAIKKSMEDVVKEIWKDFKGVAKQQSTGDNDSIEDVIIAIGRVKTEDGLLLGYKEAWQQVKLAMRMHEETK